MRLFVKDSPKMSKQPITGGQSELQKPLWFYRAGELTQFGYDALPNVFSDQAVAYLKANKDELPDNPVELERTIAAFDQLYLDKLLPILMADYDGVFSSFEVLMNIFLADSTYIDDCFKEALRVNPGLNPKVAAYYQLINPPRQPEHAEPERGQSGENPDFLSDSADVPKRSRRAGRRK